MSRTIALGLLTAALFAPAASAVAQEHLVAHEDHYDVDGVHHDHDHDHDHAHHGHGHVSLGAIFADGNFLASLVSFGLLLALAVFFLRRPIRNALEKRKAELESAVAEANRVREEAEQKKAELEARLAKLDEELAEIRTEIQNAAEAERDRIVQEAEAKAAIVRKDTKFQIEQRMKQLREDLTREAVDAAIRAAERLLAEKTTPADQQRLAEAYLEELVKVSQPEVRS
ncbi:MAG: ATP synthase F0 subunit B [Myxococcales bacterium]|nr:ATP synthase F0 subunit B [Myxococcales bacterium]